MDRDLRPNLQLHQVVRQVRTHQYIPYICCILKRGRVAQEGRRRSCRQPLLMATNAQYSKVAP